MELTTRGDRRFPAIGATLGAMKNHLGDPPRATAARPFRVLIADDSRVVQRYLGLGLGLIPGAELAGRAFNTEDALCRVRKMRPDLLVLDIEMPSTSGLAVLKAIPFDEARPLIFVLTLHASPVLARHCLALGADRFFGKDNDLPELLNAIADYAAQPPSRLFPSGLAHDGTFPSLHPAAD